jgi:hypothetical protein
LSDEASSSKAKKKSKAKKSAAIRSLRGKYKHDTLSDGN